LLRSTSSLILQNDVLYSIMTYSLIHRNEKNTFKVTQLLNTFNSFKLKQNNILYQIIIKFVHQIVIFKDLIIYKSHNISMK
jgi:hypothetical protein